MYARYKFEWMKDGELKTAIVIPTSGDFSCFEKEARDRGEKMFSALGCEFVQVTRLEEVELTL